MIFSYVGLVTSRACNHFEEIDITDDPDRPQGDVKIGENSPLINGRFVQLLLRLRVTSLLNLTSCRQTTVAYHLGTLVETWFQMVTWFILGH